MINKETYNHIITIFFMDNLIAIVNMVIDIYFYTIKFDLSFWAIPKTAALYNSFFKGKGGSNTILYRYTYYMYINKNVLLTQFLKYSTICLGMTIIAIERYFKLFSVKILIFIK